jgi:hypothetical protein
VDLAILAWQGFLFSPAGLIFRKKGQLEEKNNMEKTNRLEDNISEVDRFQAEILEKAEHKAYKFIWTLQGVGQILDQGLLLFFLHHLKNKNLSDFRLVGGEEIKILGQIVTIYHFLGQGASGIKDLGTVKKMVINGEQFFSIRE